jgi:biopolymer transport protein ExbD
MIKAYYFILLVFLLNSCINSSIDLPHSDYSSKLPRPSITRNIFFQLKGNSLYHKDSLISDLDHFQDHLDEFVKMNEGSNNFRIVFACSKSTNYKVVDSIFNKLRDHLFLKLFLLTNNVKDSIGIQIFLPPPEMYESIIDPLRLDSISKSIYKAGIFKDRVFLNDQRIKKSHYKDSCKSISSHDKTLIIYPSAENSYGDIVFLLGTYLDGLFELKNEYAKNEYGMPYNLLPRITVQEKIDLKYRRNVIISRIKERNLINSTPNSTYP